MSWRSGAERAGLGQELDRVGRQIRNAVDVVEEGGGTRSLVADLRALEQRQDEIAAATGQAAPAEPVPALRPDIAEAYRSKLDGLEAALSEPDTASLAKEALRSLTGEVTVYPGERRGEVRAELRGDLAAFMRLPDVARATPCAGGLAIVVGTLVAGAGFEPAAFRL